MSDLCHICGPVKHEAPTVICAPCALTDARVRIVIDEDTRPVWEAAKRAAAEVATWPEWKRGR